MEEYGELKYIKKELIGEWVHQLIQKIGDLYIYKSNNQFIISKNNNNNNNNKLNLNIASFLTRSYLIKIKNNKLNDENYISMKPHNIILDYCEIDNLNDLCIFNINLILNHPEFSNCNSIQDIELQIPNIKEL